MSENMSQREDEDEARDRIVVLFRHGIAEERTADKSDEERALTPEGHARMMRIAAGLERALPKAQAIYSSPLVRAVQTAQWIAKAYRSRIKVIQTDALVPGSSHEEFLDFLADVPERRIIVVGHEPNLTHNASSLLGVSTSGGMELKKGGCYAVRIHPEGSAVLDWALSPRILRKLAE